MKIFFTSTFELFIKLSKKFSRKGLYIFLKKEFSKIETHKKVLLIGSGGEINRILDNYANKNLFFTQSFDISDKRNPDILGDICKYNFKNNKYDYVVISEVLEHTHSPHLAIKNINNILNTNGKIILTVPFIFPIHDLPYDYYRFTKYGLEFLFKEFDDVVITERNTWIEAINVLFIRLIMEKNYISKIFGILFTIIFTLIFPITFLVSRILKTSYITTGYLLTAKKNNAK